MVQLQNLICMKPNKPRANKNLQPPFSLQLVPAMEKISTQNPNDLFETTTTYWLLQCFIVPLVAWFHPGQSCIIFSSTVIITPFFFSSSSLLLHQGPHVTHMSTRLVSGPMYLSRWTYVISDVQFCTHVNFRVGQPEPESYSCWETMTEAQKLIVRLFPH